MHFVKSLESAESIGNLTSYFQNALMLEARRRTGAVPRVGAGGRGNMTRLRRLSSPHS
jgi:hypothetical protein